MKQFSLVPGHVELSVAFTNYCVYLLGVKGGTQRDQVYLTMWVLGMEHRSSGLAARNLGHLFVFFFRIYLTSSVIEYLPAV